MIKQQTKAIPDFPRALYGCEEQGCAEEESHFPEDLWLITNPPKGWDPGWYCEGCADEAHFQNPDTQTGETLEHYLGLERDIEFTRSLVLDSSDKVKAEMLAALQTILEIIDSGELYDAPLGEDCAIARMKDIAQKAINRQEG